MGVEPNTTLPVSSLKNSQEGFPLEINRLGT